MKAVKFLLPLALMVAGAGNAAAQTTHQIDLVGTVFTPADIVIDQGDTVVWNWVSGFHNVVSNEDMWSSGAPLTGPHTFTITFDAAFMAANPANGNVYGFHCEVHEALGMFGSVTVNTASPVLTITNFNAGQTASLDVAGAAPGAIVGYAYSLSGAGPTSFTVPGCGALSLSLSNPVTVLGTTNADAAGNAAIPANLPAGISGMRVWVQAVDVTSCAQSNGATMIVG
jgi:plastocyanin